MSLGLLGAYDSDSDSGSEEEEKPAPPVEEIAAPALSNPFKTFKSGTSNPRPSFMVDSVDYTSKSQEGNSNSANSVFNNPFRAKEDKKKAVLEQHVAMTLKQEEQRTIEGRKVCWNFRKGRCRFGHNCTFAHDSDVGIQKRKEAKDAADPEFGKPNYEAKSGETQAPEKKKPNPPIVIGDDAVITGDNTMGYKKKKRPGLGDGITPGKKAMKFHNKVYNNSS